MAMTTLRTGAIVQALGGELFGDPDRQITRLAPLERAQPGELSFLVNPRLAPSLASSRAGCVIVGPALAEAARARGDCIVAADPHLYFARLTQLWRRLHGGAARPGIHPSAVVEEGALVDPSASVGALCFIGRGARIIICGAISQYNNTTPVQGPKNYLSLLVNRARMEGIVVFDYADRYHLAVAEMAGYLKDGRMKSKEDIVEGLDNFPEALLKLFSGANFGKLVLKVADA